MKTVFIFLFFLNSFYINAQQIIICGNVKNAVNKEFMFSFQKEPVSGITYDFSDSIKENGDFKIVVDDIEKFIDGAIQLGKEEQFIYLEPNDSIYITVEDGKFDETIKYSNGISGNNQECYNKYYYTFIFAPMLQAKQQKDRKHKVLYDTADDVRVAEESIHWSDSTKSIELNFIDSFNSKLPVSNSFLHYIKSEIIYKHAVGVLMLPFMKKFYGENKQPGSPKFPKIYDEYVSRFNVNDEKMIGYLYYINFLSNIISMNEDRQIDFLFNDISKRYLLKQKIIDSIFTNRNVRNIVLAKEVTIGLFEGNYTYLLPMYEKFKEQNFDATLVEAVQYKMSTASHLKKDDFAPKFTLNDIDGKEVSLNNFKGKLIYIDFWATSCAPCIVEMSASKKLQIRYGSEEIVFIYISIDEDEKKWKEVIKNRNLTGIQLHTNGCNSPIAKVYGISAVPEYILIDQKGRIIKYGAPHPSDNSITKLFNQYLPKTKNTELPNFKFNPNGN